MYFESINCWTLAACISYTGEVSYVLFVPLPSLRWGLPPGVTWNRLSDQINVQEAAVIVHHLPVTSKGNDRLPTLTWYAVLQFTLSPLQCNTVTAVFELQINLNSRKRTLNV